MDSFMSTSQVDENSMRYYIGYVAFKIIKRNNCDNCINDMTKPNLNMDMPSELFLFNKSYNVASMGGLKYPSETFYEINKLQIVYFKNTFKDVFHQKDIRSIYTEECINVSYEISPDWFDKNGPCYNHRVDALKYMLLVLIRKNCKWQALNKKSYKHKVDTLKK